MGSAHLTINDSSSGDFHSDIGTPWRVIPVMGGVSREQFGSSSLEWRTCLDLHTAGTRIVWQSYRVSFKAVSSWQRVHLPFAEFMARRIDVSLNLRSLKCIELVAIGSEFVADSSIASVMLCR